MKFCIKKLNRSSFKKNTQLTLSSSLSDLLNLDIFMPQSTITLDNTIIIVVVSGLVVVVIFARGYKRDNIPLNPQSSLKNAEKRKTNSQHSLYTLYIQYAQTFVSLAFVDSPNLASLWCTFFYTI